MYISACKKSADGFGEKAKIDRLLKKIFAIETPCNTIDSIKIEKYEKFERYSNDIEFKIYLSPVVLRISLNSLIVTIFHVYTRVTPALGTTHSNKIVTKLDSRKGACSR